MRVLQLLHNGDLSLNIVKGSFEDTESSFLELGPLDDLHGVHTLGLVILVNHLLHFPVRSSNDELN